MFSLRRQVEQGLEREAPPPALRLRDGARRDAGEAGQVRLAEVARDPEAAQGGAEPSRGRRGGEHRQSFLERVPVDAALDAGRAPLGLRDPQPPVADDEHALRDPLDLAPEGGCVAGGRE